ncbi:MAG: protein kinase [Planctomycetota bacterium]
MISSDKDIFLQALEIEDPAQRGAFLDEACQGDEQLRSRVDTLLRSAEMLGGFLETPAMVEQFDLSQSNETEKDVLSFLSPGDQEGSLGRIGHFEVQSVLGEGGAGLVLKAMDTKLSRHIAIKVLSPLIAANRNARVRFVAEANAAAAISHPNVTAIHTIDEHNQLPYLVMEWVDGQTLERAIQERGRLAIASAIKIGLQIARGLAAAHKQGLIHRDIKPANILLVSESEQVKITDFGLARAIDDASVTQAGFMSGTPQYMSPEQAAGETLDQRTDLFSLGCVLYAMCTGASPFKADTTIATIRRLCDETPQPINKVNPSVPHDLCILIDKLLEKKPEDRWQSAEEIIGLLAGQLQALSGLDSNLTMRSLLSAQQSVDESNGPGVLCQKDSSDQQSSSKPGRVAKAVFLSVIILSLLTLLSELSGVTQFLAGKPSRTSDVKPLNETSGSDGPSTAESFYERLTSDRYRWSEPINLGPPISTVYDESYPRLTADGLLLVFSSTRPYPEGQSTSGDIWIAERPSVDAPFSEPVNQGPSINTERVEGQPSLSGDGLILVFSRQRLDGSGYDLWVANRDSRDSPWSQAQKMGGGFIGEYEYNNCANLSIDGLTLDFTSMALGGRPCIPQRSTRLSVTDPWPDPTDISLTTAPLTRNFQTFNFASGNHLAVMLSIPDEGRTLFVRETADNPWVRLEVTDEDLRPEGTNVGNAFERFISVDGSTIIYDASWDTGLGERDIWMIQSVERVSD